MEEAIEIVANEIYPSALDEASIKPYGPGTLQKVVSTEPVVLEFVVSLEAEVELGDYHSIRMDYVPPSVEESEIEDILQNLRERNAIQEPVDREIQVGDQVTLKISANRIGITEEQESDLIQEQSIPIIITGTSENKNEWPFPGFSGYLVGHNKEDYFTFSHTFDDDAVYSSLRGVSAEFNITVDEVKSRSLPELNDEFAATIGDFQTLESLRKQINDDLGNQKSSTYNSEYEEKVIQQIVELSQVKFSPQMLEKEIDVLINELESRLHEQKLEMDLYLKSRKMDLPALREEIKPSAEVRLKRSLVLYEVADKEKVKVSPEELQEETSKTLSYLSRGLPDNEIKRLNNRNIISNIMNNVMVEMLSRKTMEQIRLLASGNLPLEPDDDVNPELEHSPETSEPDHQASSEDIMTKEDNE